MQFGAKPLFENVSVKFGTEESASYSAMSLRMMAAVYLAISRPVLKRFWIRMRAAYSGLIALQLLPFFSFSAATALISF
ncbi:hypothetical protein X922_16935 [Pseudomonas aeruginosa VRFPA08]|nr:hypothetical protein X922_16935 [Pseudomonas aeruginosa VRFPA08]